MANKFNNKLNIRVYSSFYIQKPFIERSDMNIPNLIEIYSTKTPCSI